MRWILVWLILGGVCMAPIHQSPASEPTYQTQNVAGWTLHLDSRLSQSQKEATARAIELLESQLKEIVRVVPEPAVARLRQVPLYFSPEYPGVPPRAEYHPSAGWLRNNGRNVAMARAVEFTNVRSFESESRRMPMLALHELAHAYHDRFLPQGFANAELKAAHRRAVDGGKYDDVERRDAQGRTSRDRAYAMTTPQEYFAESSEAYFGTNDFFPYTRDQFQTFDPEMVELVRRLWSQP